MHLCDEALEEGLGERERRRRNSSPSPSINLHLDFVRAVASSSSAVMDGIPKGRR